MLSPELQQIDAALRKMRAGAREAIDSDPTNEFSKGMWAAYSIALVMMRAVREECAA